MQKPNRTLLSFNIKRVSIFDDQPYVLHVAANTKGEILAKSESEIAIIQVENDASFNSILFESFNLQDSELKEIKPLGQSVTRIERTIFDRRNRSRSNLAIGEVINLPGCWSQYPPCRQSQPKLCHYRFTEPQGYGHSELGEEVFKVKQYDTKMFLSRKKPIN
jgi:5-deoxy-D-glucuronate isomerase